RVDVYGLLSAERSLYALVAGSAGEQVPILGVAGRPADHCQDPCGAAKKQGLDKKGGKEAAGGVICCSGKKYICVWKPGEATNPRAVAIVTKCIIEHESDHLDDLDCPRFWCYGFPTRPPFKKEKRQSANAEECSAYKIELNCLQSNRSQCGGDHQCESEVDLEIHFLTDERNKRNCPP
ncbi:MAG: hypothetical protein L0Z50_06390, partial [Verrucomicrobiales bacterium]|nr:hypothetical protein [Verrucomicrobiales bacterium]